MIVRRRLPGGRWTSPDVFRKQRFCSIRCGAIHQGPVSRRMHYLRAQPYRKSFCEDCGVKDDDAILHVHHLDSDYTNDDPSNYRTVCAERRDGQPSCHDKRHGRRTWFPQNRQEKQRVRRWRRLRRGPRRRAA
jgi:hypothetical protein